MLLTRRFDALAAGDYRMEKKITRLKEDRKSGKRRRGKNQSALFNAKWHFSLAIKH